MELSLIARLVAALLLHYPHSPARQCIWQHQIDIVSHLQASEELGVPAGLMLSVAFQESHVGCDEPDWGAPISRRQRHVAGTPEHAAHALARSYTVCGNWEGAVTRFRTGLCTLRRGDPRLDYVRIVLHRAGILYGIAWEGAHVFPFESTLPRCRVSHSGDLILSLCDATWMF